jgi:RNA polymerase sigma-70 factor, ECF subfamily
LALKFDVFKAKMKTEAELISDVKAGITSAFDTLFGIYSLKIYYFAFSILKSKEDAEDVVQHTFFKVWEKRENLNNNLVFKSFLFTIAYNVSIDLLRMRLKEKGYRENILVQASLNYNLEERIELGDLLDRINEIAKDLPPRKREIYQLSRVHNLSYNEIAEKLNISVKTVENGIGYSLKYIKSHLGNDPVLGLLIAWLLL